MAYLAQLTGLNPKQKEYLSKIQYASSSLLGIINDILDFSKIEAGKLDIELAPFILDDVFSHLANITSQKAIDKGLQCVFNISNSIPKILIGDSLRIGQILINLVNNAIKFTDRGEILITCIETKRYLNYHQKIELCFSVSDTGIGISPTQKSKLFQAFIQGDGSTTRLHGGTGLGLSISKRLVELMHGQIDVESILGAGSTFTFVIELPIAPIKKPNFPGEKSDLLNLVSLRLTAKEHSELQDSIESLHMRDQINLIQIDEGIHEFSKLQTAQKNLNKIDLILINGHNFSGQARDLVEFLKSFDIDIKPAIICSCSNMQNEWCKKLEHSLSIKFIEKSFTKNIFSAIFKDIIDQFSVEAKLLVPSNNLSSLNKSTSQKIHRILLAEDNEFNQEIAQELLAQQGFEVYLAKNGKEAITLLQSHHDDWFSLILMDLEMPEMDGHLATIEIRKHVQFSQLPIIALTAHAIKGTRERCVKEGMQDYLTKPFDPEILFSTIKTWIGEDPHQKSSTQAPSETIENFAFRTLDITKGLRSVAGNKQLFHQLLERYLHAQRTGLEDIIGNHTAISIDLLQRHLHTLKGLSATIGARSLEQIIIETEDVLATDTTCVTKPEFSVLMRAIESALRAVLEEISAYLDQAKSKPETTVQARHDLDSYGMIIDKLCDLLDASSAEALDYFQKNLSVLAANIDTSILASLTDTIYQYDFDAALTQILKLKQFKSINE
jgi:CheY-like chemotaxis protein